MQDSEWIDIICKRQHRDKQVRTINVNIICIHFIMCTVMLIFVHCSVMAFVYVLEFFFFLTTKVVHVGYSRPFFLFVLLLVFPFLDKALSGNLTVLTLLV